MKFKACGIDFEIGYEVVAAMSAVLILDTKAKIICCFLAAVIHELGHLIAMRCFCIKPSVIKLRLFDIAIVDNTQKTFGVDMIITLAGVGANFLFSFIFSFFSVKLMMSNIVIGIFNILPVESLDGGHALSMLLLKKISYESTQKVIKVLSFLFLLPLLFVGICVLFESKYNYSLLIIGLYLVVVLFIK